MLNNNLIKIIVASDIHLADHHIKSLIEREQDPDLLLLLGDFLNLEHTSENEDQEQEFLIQLLEPFKQWKCEKYMIPGNHDCKDLFHDKQLSDWMPNIHGKSVKFRDINILGFGGSTPSFKNNHPHWKGYPYQSEEQFAQEFKFENQQKYILATHIGPSISPTSVSFEEGTDQPIESGSKTLSKFITDNKPIFHVHGHTHDGVGYRWINNIKIINAGPLCYGNYVKITLSQWEIISIEHILL